MKSLKYLVLVLSVFTTIVWLSDSPKPTPKQRGLVQTNLQFMLRGFVADQELSYAVVQDTVAWYFEKVKGAAEKSYQLALHSGDDPTHRPGVDPDFRMSTDINFASWKDKVAFYHNLARQEGINIKYMPGKGGGMAGLVDLNLPIPGSDKRLEVKNAVFLLGSQVFFKNKS